MKKVLALFFSLIIVFFFASTMDAQDTASTTWSLQADQTFITSGNINGTNQAVVGLTPAYEIPGSGSVNKVQKTKPDATTSDVGGTGTWPAETQPNANRYVQFSVSPQANINFSVTSILLLIGSKGVHTINASIYYSTDSSFTTKTLIAEKDSLISNAVLPDTFNITAAVNSGQTFYVRIYPWSSAQITSTSKYFYLGNVIISGTTASVPVPASATWFLTSSQSATTSGVVNAQDQYFSNLGSYSYTTLGGESCDRIITLPINSGTWPAESSPNLTRYIQYAVSPKAGGTFYADTISFKLGAQFTNNLRAAVYYSQDTSFTNAVMLVDTALNSSNLVQNGFVINDTVKTGKTFYLRIYPYDTKAEGFAKLICVANVAIGGFTIGVAASEATLTTVVPTYISTTFATSGGNITADGGGTVTARGVCWDTASSPTILNNKTVDGAGTGAFVSHITGLTAGKTYYVRAYATNISGTAYDTTLISFTTLESLLVPTVTTTAPSNILNKSAQAGGNVTAWDGDTVTARGVCWNTTGDPTIINNKTADGTDIGVYKSAMIGLNPSTTYYYRAYATNGVGTGYGAIDTFMTQQTAPPVTKVVAKDGSGDYTTVQAAFEAVPDNYTGTYTIFVKNGIYKEKDSLASTKENVVLEGENRDSTIITFDSYANITGGTSTSQSVAIDASDFTAINITFQNTYKNDGSAPNQQAVALRVNGDRQAYYNCKLLGYQDTYYTWGGAGAGRIYMKDCYIEGSVDFIFGRDIVVFDSCTIHENRNNGTLTAASTDATSKFGYVFLNSTITVDSIGFDGNAITTFYLGRPWQSLPQTVFLNCYEPATLNPAGWLAWNVANPFYAEYNCSGPGYTPSQRVAWSAQLTSTQAADYTVANIFSKNSSPAFAYDWTPVQPIITSVKDNQEKKIPINYSLYQNYPNPFNPSTIIKYSVPKVQVVTLKIYNVLGQLVTTLVNKQQPAGNYEITFNADKLASGIYFYSLSAGDFHSTKKMLLLK